MRILKLASIVLLTGLFCMLAIPKDGGAASVPHAGDDQCVCMGCEVTLDGSKSGTTNPPIEYYWWFPATNGKPLGSTAAISDPYAKNPTFTADVPGLYQVKLKVKGDGEDWQGPDIVNILSKGFCPGVVIVDAYTSGQAGTPNINYKPGDDIYYHVVYYVKGRLDKEYRVKVKVKNSGFSRENGVPANTWISSGALMLRPGRYHTVLPGWGSPDTVPGLIDGGMYPVQFKVKMKAHGLGLSDMKSNSILVKE